MEPSLVVVTILYAFVVPVLLVAGTIYVAYRLMRRAVRKELDEFARRHRPQ